MSLPNDDDDDDNGRRQPWRNHHFGSRIGGRDASPIKKPALASSSHANRNTDDSSSDDRTTAETSVGSMSFSSDITSSITAPGAANNSIRQRHGAIHSSHNINNHNINSNINNNYNAERDDSSIQSGDIGFHLTAEETLAIQQRRLRNRRQLQRLGIATGASFAIFVYLLIPTALLLSMILFGTVSTAFFFRFAEVILWEFDRTILEGRGIGDYLPRGLYELLTERSVHDFLSDPDGIFGGSEHIPYLLLYIVPGLTPQQRNEYVGRLSHNHRRLLLSDQGLLGFFLNRNNHRRVRLDEGTNENETPNRDSRLMRFLMGDERMRQWRERQPVQSLLQNPHPNINSSRRLELPPTIPEGSEERPPSQHPPTTSPLVVVAPDNSAATAHALSSAFAGRIQEEARGSSPASFTNEHPAAATTTTTMANHGAGSLSVPEPPGIPVTVAAIVGRGIDSVTNQPSGSLVPVLPAGSEARRQNTNASRANPSVTEDSILLDAIGSAIANLVGETTRTVRVRARESFRDNLEGPLLRAGLGATAIGLGIGTLGLLNGTYDLPSLARPFFEVLSSLLGSSSTGNSSTGSSTPPSFSSFRPSMPSASFLLGATAASGATTVVLGLFGGGNSSTSSHYNRYHKDDDDDDDDESSEKKDSDNTKDDGAICE